MRLWYHLTRKSGTGKTGAMPVSTTGRASCPDTCALKGDGGCFGENHPGVYHWNKVSAGERGTGSVKVFARWIRALAPGIIWRHGFAGDLPGVNTRLNVPALMEIVRANRKGRKRGFGYTHKPLTPKNVAAIRKANRNGFTINISCDNDAQADRAKEINAGPVTVVCASTTRQNYRTPAGHLVVLCPASVRHGELVKHGEGIQCGKPCTLCMWPEREVIIGFPAHGARRKRIDELIQITGGVR